MGCGTAIQVEDPIKMLSHSFRLIDLNYKPDDDKLHSRIFLFGQNKTHRKVVQCDPQANHISVISKRTRIPRPKLIHDPVQLAYQQTQQLFNLGIYGSDIDPPFNKMLVLTIQDNLLFLCGGKDYDGYNVMQKSYFYFIYDDEIIKQKTSMADMNQNNKQIKSRFSRNTFENTSNMNQKRYGHFGILIHSDYNIFVFGGYDQHKQITNKCQKYSIHNKQWKTIASMKVPRAEGNCFQFRNKIYVFGGKSSHSKMTKIIQEYDHQTDTWKNIQVKIHRGISHFLIFTNHPNEIMIVGGHTHNQTSNSVIKINLVNRTYIWDSNLQLDYDNIKGVAVKNGMIVFGGQKNIIQRYCESKWEKRRFEHQKLLDLEDIQLFSCQNQSIVVSSSIQNNNQLQAKQTENVIFGNDKYPCIIAYSSQNGQFRKQPVPMTVRLKSCMGIVQFQRHKYMLAGGCDWRRKKDSKSVFIYNFKTKMAQEIVKMPYKKYNFAFIQQNKQFYVFGGTNKQQGHSLRQCEVLNLQNSTWSILPVMKKARNECFAQSIGMNKIAVFGGWSLNMPVFGIQIFDTATQAFHFYQPTQTFPDKILSSFYRKTQNQLCLFSRDNSNNHHFVTIKLNNIQQEKIGKSQKIIKRKFSGMNIIQYEVTKIIQNINSIHQIKKYQVKNQHQVNSKQPAGQDCLLVNVASKPVDFVDAVTDLQTQKIKQDADVQIDSIQFKSISYPKQEVANETILIQEKQEQQMEEPSPIIITDATFKKQSQQIKQHTEPHLTVEPINWLQQKVRYQVNKTMSHIFFFNKNQSINFSIQNEHPQQMQICNSKPQFLNQILS